MAWFRGKPGQWPWCSVFTRKDMRLLEDSEDLFYYHQDGYVFGITREMSVRLLNDLLTSLTKPGIRLMFGHSETLLPLLTTLGIARDEPGSSRNNMPTKRLWRTSLI